ncbi:chromate efflux transporter [Flavobacterium sufflavum]|uniref:Chromate efflux transporter n=1 Tax=Flavobacterium sufflavum TaxID=1921138 RepID=A0A3S2TZF0_9FLAO|nr:chromate efflux transporter [Flavobacterium sufflavum]RVT72805.1 chromate efflux transporter [Flavobacterium sufflavum]
MNEKERLKELAQLFLKLGIIGFGGPAVHLAMMQNEVVVKRKWLDEQHFLDLLGATYLIPGPNSTEMAIHIGHERAGVKGLIVAGLCFILPAVILTGFFAWLYKEYGQLPEMQPFLYGIKPAIIAIILGAILPLAKKSCKTISLGIIGVIVLALSLLHFNEIALLFGAGFLSLFWFSIKSRSLIKSNWIPLGLLPVSKTTLVAASNWNLFLIFFKIGAILYGSGYVLFAFLDAELVAKGLLSRTELIDAIAVGQFTPGPVFSSVTFVGYQINGISGAMVATLAVFLPSFIFVGLLNPLVNKMRNLKLFSVFLDAVNVSSVAIIISICIQMGRDTITDWRTVFIALVSVFIAFNYKKVNSAFIVIGGAFLGYLLTFI